MDVLCTVRPLCMITLYVMRVCSSLHSCTSSFQPESRRPSLQSNPMKPLSHRERCYVQKHGIFLLRNLAKVRLVQQQKSGCNTPVPEQHDKLTKSLSEEGSFHLPVCP